jgi:hypothetical protein
MAEVDPASGDADILASDQVQSWTLYNY